MKRIKCFHVSKNVPQNALKYNSERDHGTMWLQLFSAPAPISYCPIQPTQTLATFHFQCSCKIIIKAKCQSGIKSLKDQVWLFLGQNQFLLSKNIGYVSYKLTGLDLKRIQIEEQLCTIRIRGIRGICWHIKQCIKEV